MIGDPMEAWKTRGQELNAIYDTLARTMREVLPRGGVPTAIPSAEAACLDIEALGAEVERLREALTEIVHTPAGRMVHHADGSTSFSVDGFERCVDTAGMALGRQPEHAPASTAEREAGS